jgi:hypothetical protein
VVAHYALAMSAVVHEGAPSRLRRHMPEPVPVVFLSRLAVDRAEQVRHLGGEALEHENAARPFASGSPIMIEPTVLSLTR